MTKLRNLTLSPRNSVSGSRLAIVRSCSTKLVLTAEETKTLLATCDLTTIVGWRARALFSVRVYDAEPFLKT